MSYADDIEYAARNLIELAMREQEALDNAIGQLREAERLLQIQQWDFQTSDLNEDFSEGYVMAAFARAARTGQEVNNLNSQVNALQATVGAHQFAVQAICGSILQIAKQGISFVHGNLASAPDGRTIGTSSLKDIVWQARNQTIHFEDNNFHPPVTALFAAIEATHGQQFSLAAHPRQNLARAIVQLLGWQTYDTFLADLRLLGL